MILIYLAAIPVILTIWVACACLIAWMVTYLAVLLKAWKQPVDRRPEKVL